MHRAFRISRVYKYFVTEQPIHSNMVPEKSTFSQNVFIKIKMIYIYIDISSY